MVILINVSCVSHNHRGMGFFTKEIVSDLINLSEREYEFIFISANDLDETFAQQIQGYKTIIIKTPLPIFEQIIIPYLIKLYNPTICWFPSNTFPIIKPRNTKYIATIHDLIYFKKGKQRSLYQEIGKIYRKVNVKFGLSKIDIITSVSKSSLIEIYRYFNIESKIDERQVLYNSVHLDKIDCIDNSIISDLNLVNQKFIYTISGSSYNKNLKFFIEAFQKFNIKNEYKLVVSGLRENEWELFEDKNVIFTTYISGAKKNALLSKSNLFVMASLDEGFGIPLIEAMYFNSNVIASNIEVFKEIGDDYIWYFDPSNINFLLEYYSKKEIFFKEAKVEEQRNYVDRKFSKKLTINKLLSIFEGIYEV